MIYSHTVIAGCDTEVYSQLELETRKECLWEEELGRPGLCASHAHQQVRQNFMPNVQSHTHTVNGLTSWPHHAHGGHKHTDSLSINDTWQITNKPRNTRPLYLDYLVLWFESCHLRWRVVIDCSDELARSGLLTVQVEAITSGSLLQMAETRP